MAIAVSCRYMYLPVKMRRPQTLVSNEDGPYGSQVYANFMNGSQSKAASRSWALGSARFLSEFSLRLFADDDPNAFMSQQNGTIFPYRRHRNAKEKYPGA